MRKGFWPIYQIYNFLVSVQSIFGVSIQEHKEEKNNLVSSNGYLDFKKIKYFVNLKLKKRREIFSFFLTISEGKITPESTHR